MGRSSAGGALLLLCATASAAAWLLGTPARSSAFAAPQRFDPFSYSKPKTTAAPPGSFPYLVAQVKSFQRMGDEQSELWETFARANTRNVDPAMYNAAALEEFCAGNDVPPPLPKVPGTIEYLVAQVKAFQRMGYQQTRLWKTFADQTTGRLNPAGHEFAALEEFCTSNQVPPPPVLTPGTFDYLVAQVKAFQRMGAEQSELWKAFADRTPAAPRWLLDPAKHQVSMLEEFCTSHAVPAPPAPSPGTLDYLVEQVKAFQRMGDEQSELWAIFVRNHGGSLDPARTSTVKLEEFCNSHPVPPLMPATDTA